MSYDVFWQHPIGQPTPGWLEKIAFIKNWMVKVGGHESEYFLAVMVSITTAQRVELPIAKTKNLELACTLAASAAKIMINEVEERQLRNAA